jgi:preprotein translocase subunit YajC
MSQIAIARLALQQPASDGGGALLQMVFLLVVFGVFFYFFLWRPQRRRQQEHQALVESLKRGDEVITSGGVYGKIRKVEKEYILLEVDEEGRTLQIMKDSVIQKEKAA